MGLDAVKFYDLVTVLETDILRCLVELETVLHFVQVDVVLTPCEKYHRVDEHSEDEIEHYTTYDNQQTLPCRFRAVFPILCRLLHLLGVHRLVNHSCNLAVTAQGYPADTVLGVAVLGLPFEK